MAGNVVTLNYVCLRITSADVNFRNHVR